jgi:hypothetical protein
MSFDVEAAILIDGLRDELWPLAAVLCWYQRVYPIAMARWALDHALCRCLGADVMQQLGLVAQEELAEGLGMDRKRVLIHAKVPAVKP